MPKPQYILLLAARPDAQPEAPVRCVGVVAPTPPPQGPFPGQARTLPGYEPLAEAALQRVDELRSTGQRATPALVAGPPSRLPAPKDDDSWFTGLARMTRSGYSLNNMDLVPGDATLDELFDYYVTQAPPEGHEAPYGSDEDTDFERMQLRGAYRRLDDGSVVYNRPPRT